MTNGHGEDDERQREAREALDRVARDSGVFGQSAMVRAVNQARAHLSAEDADPNDPAELWGRRIGRTLSVIAFVALAIWLVHYLTR